MPRHLKILHEWNPPRLWFSWQKIRQFAGSNFVEIPMLSRSNVQLCSLLYSVESDSAHCCTVQRDLRHVQCQPVRSFSVLLIDCVLCKSAVWISPWQQNYLQNHLVPVPSGTAGTYCTYVGSIQERKIQKISWQWHRLFNCSMCNCF